MALMKTLTCAVMAVLAAWTAIVLADSDAPYAPEQIHIALAHPSLSKSGTHGLTVEWVTYAEADSMVWYGSSKQLKHTAKGSSTTYTFGSTLFGSYTSPLLHKATMIDLQPGSTIYYVCGDAQLGQSAARAVTLPPAIGDGSQPYTFAVVGDLGQTQDSAVTLRHILQEPLPLLTLHAGDLSYADCEQDRWDDYARLAEPAASILPWMSGPGNHEIELEEGTGRAFVAYEARYSMPAVRSATFEAEDSAALSVLGLEMEVGAGVKRPHVTDAPYAGPGASLFAKQAQAQAQQRQRQRQRRTVPWGPDCTPSEWLGKYDYGNSFYSFDVATTHVVVLNPYTHSYEGSAQYKWLLADLEGIDRSVTPWIIVMTHCPWYSSNFAHQLEAQTVVIQASLEDILLEHKVSLVVSGHVHAYERTHPLQSFTRTEGAPVFIVIGDGGNREGHASTYFAAPHWSAYREGFTFGHGRLTVANATHAHWQWRRNVDGEAEVGDAAWIVNPYTHTAGSG